MTHEQRTRVEEAYEFRLPDDVWEDIAQETFEYTWIQGELARAPRLDEFEAALSKFETATKHFIELFGRNFVRSPTECDTFEGLCIRGFGRLAESADLHRIDFLKLFLGITEKYLALVREDALRRTQGRGSGRQWYLWAANLGELLCEANLPTAKLSPDERRSPLARMILQLHREMQDSGFEACVLHRNVADETFERCIRDAMAGRKPSIEPLIAQALRALTA